MAIYQMLNIISIINRYLVVLMDQTYDHNDIH